MKGIKTALVVAVVAAFPLTSAALKKDCNELKGEIEAKIRQNDIDKFSVDIIDAGAQPTGKVVGICDGGRKQIVYRRGR